MKIQRYKKAHKTLTFYKHNFGFREPFQILIDATFCQAALQVSTLVRYRFCHASRTFSSIICHLLAVSNQHHRPIAEVRSGRYAAHHHAMHHSGGRESRFQSAGCHKHCEAIPRTQMRS